VSASALRRSLDLETKLAEKVAPVVDDIAKKLGSSEVPFHATKPPRRFAGDRALLLVSDGDEKFIHFQFDTTRAGQVSRDVLGPHFTGTLVTDCYSGYALTRLTRNKNAWLTWLERLVIGRS